MRIPRLLSILLVLFTAPLAAQAPGTGTLDIYFIDTEGGQATLLVTPGGESVLIDTGNPGGRDAERIITTLGEAGVQAIDHLLITHYHGDHHGSVLDLAERVPIRHFVDHGPPVEDNPPVRAFQEAYAALVAKARHSVVRPGDRLEVAGLDWTIVAAAGEVLSGPLPGAGQTNSACPAAAPEPGRAAEENAQSVGSFVRFGEFRLVDLGDLLVQQEFALMCPLARMGQVDLYVTSHHGQANSGSAALVHAIAPRVAVMNNGTRKGGSSEAFRVLRASPGLEDLWQLHWSHNAGIELNSPALLVANVDDPQVLAGVVTGSTDRPPAHDGPAYSIRISARADGSFTVTNTRNGFSKTYAPR